MALDLTPFGPRATGSERARVEHEAQATANAALADSSSGNDTKSVNQTTPRENPRLRAALGAGKPLTAEDKSTFSASFGSALDAVAVHEGPQADAAARSLGLLGFASGSEVVLASGLNTERDHVLAHELTHATQHASSSDAGGAPVVHGYEGPEHRDLGDAAAVDLLDYLRSQEGQEWARRYGLDPDALVRSMEADPFVSQNARIRVREGFELSPGEVIALAGDFYAGPDEIAQADEGEVDAILDVMDEQEAGTVDGSDANVRFEQITEGRYTELARRNAVHFAPGNRAEWQRLHEAAMELARSDASDAALQRAYLMDASGGHFLTDAFAAGHLIDVQQIEAAIALHLMQSPIMAQRNPEAQTILGAFAVSGDLIKLVLKNVHDRLNREGFEITNAQGMSWRTFGDDHLGESDETRRIAALAVFTSRQQIAQARAGAQPSSQDVLNLLPDDDSVARATAHALTLIPDAASESEVVSLMYRNAGILSTLPGGFIAESLVRTITSPGRERQLLDAQERGGVAPQFTIFEWD